MTMTRANHLTILEEGLRKVWQYWLNSKPMVYPQIFDVRSSKKRKETDLTYAGIGMLDKKNEGEPITYEDFTEGYDTVYTHSTFAKGIRITEELIEDDLYGVMGKRSKALGIATRYRMEYDHASIFNTATTAPSTPFSGGDGLALLSSSHTLAGVPGTTKSNTASSDLTLSALETAITHFRTMVDDMNMQVAIEPAVLLIPPQLEFDAYEIINSGQKPYTADNETNALKGRLKIVIWDFLTDSDSWFVLADKMYGAPISFNRVAPQFGRDGDFDTGDLKMKARCRYSYGWSDWRWCYGSLGA